MKRIVLPKSGRDLSAFRLEGSLDGLPVSGCWDGRVLAVSDRLVARAVLARAVDSVYGEAGFELTRSGFSITDSASAALLTLIELCEDLTCIEYESGTDSRKLV